MSRSSPYARISLTLPPEVLAHADRLAQELDRSRSWVIAEALRHYSGAPLAAGPEIPAAVSVPSPELAAASPLAPHRLAALLTDLALTPEARVRAGEEAAGPVPEPPEPRFHLLAFGRLEDYLAWRHGRGERP